MRVRPFPSAPAIALGLAGVIGCSSSNSQSTNAGRDAGARRDAHTLGPGSDGSTPPTDASAADRTTSNDSGGVHHADSSAGGDSGSCHGDTSPLPCMSDSVFYESLPASPEVASNSSAIMAYYAANWALD